MITLESLAEAAEWGHFLCLNCGATYDLALGPECPVCAEERTIEARDGLRLIEILQSEES